MRMRARTLGTCVVAIVTCTTFTCFATLAWAAASVTIPAGYPQNNQVISVTGSGFPVHVKDPTGLAILECADPGGTVAKLPTSALTCDGSTTSPLQINTDSQGNFKAKYRVFALSDLKGSNINCDKTHFCVLWVGVDFNGDFLGPHAFSSAFEVGAIGSATSGSSSTIFIVIPIVVVVVAGGAFLVARARRRSPSQMSASSS